MNEQQKSNGDVIRGMSDEELADFLNRVKEGDVDFAITFCDLCCEERKKEGKSTECEECVSWWVKNGAKLPQGLKYWEDVK